MNPTKCNGPDAPHDRPAKTLTKNTTDFIATCARLTRAAPEQIPMFEGPEFCPILPPHGSAAETALHDLLARDLTQIDWLAERKGWRLSAAVKQLDYLGWEPQSILIQHPAWPNAIALYSLPQKAKQAVAAMRGDNHA